MSRSQQQPITAPVAAPFVPPSDPRAILTTAEVAAWLRVHSREVQRMGVPRTVNRHKTIRYRVGDVMAWLDRQSKQKGAGR